MLAIPLHIIDTDDFDLLWFGALCEVLHCAHVHSRLSNSSVLHDHLAARTWLMSKRKSCYHERTCYVLSVDTTVVLMRFIIELHQWHQVNMSLSCNVRNCKCFQAACIRPLWSDTAGTWSQKV